MIRNDTGSSRQIEFTFNAPEARFVGVAGSFNSWDAAQAPLRKRGDGFWGTTLKLVPGRYEYRFVADGKWFTDPSAKEAVPNPYGARNSVVVV